MNIEFPQELPGVPTAEGDVSVPVRVDGLLVGCRITAEALEDHFGAAGFDSASLVSAFQSNRAAIEEKARQVLLLSGGKPVLLQTHLF